MADIVVLNKIDTARRADVARVLATVREVNPEATLIRAASPVTADRPDLIKGKRVLVIEDGPSLTHGDMNFGAGIVAARKYRAKKCVDPRPFVVGEIKQTMAKYPRIVDLIPAMGYTAKQIRDLETSIKRCKCDAVVNATPADLPEIMKIEIPVARVSYELKEIGRPDIASVLRRALRIRR